MKTPKQYALWLCHSFIPRHVASTRTWQTCCASTEVPFGFPSRFRWVGVVVWLAMVFAIVNPYAASAQILKDLLQAANSGPIPRETDMNVPGKTVRIKVGEINTATWIGKPIWNVDGEIKFGPLHFNINGTPIELNVTGVQCLGLDDQLEKSTSANVEYDKENGSPAPKHWPIILEFKLPKDERLYSQTVTAHLKMRVEYLGIQNRSYQAPTVSPTDATMESPVSFKIASAEDAKKYSSIGNSDAFQNITFYGGLAFCFVLLIVIGNVFFGHRRR